MLKERFFRQVVKLRAEVASTPELPFSRCLTQEQIEAELDNLGRSYRERIYSPWATIWIFLSQVLSPDHSCREALARFAAFRAARGLPPCSTETGSYCEARQRLPAELLAQLTRQTGRELHEQALVGWKFHGRDIQTVDGSIISMPDTADNADFFGKNRNQKGRIGFPLARIVVRICLATGAVLDLAIGSYRGKRTGELSLFRSLQDRLKAGNIVLGDRLFCTYCDIARLAARGVDCVFRLHALRSADFRRGRRLGRDERLVTLQKPTSRPDWLSAKEFFALPAELALRQIRVQVKIPGFRVRSLVVVTTLTDRREFSRVDIADLFRQRWQAELDLRSIKTVMQMDVLRCKTPDMIRKEMWTHVLAYNLLRSLMCAAATEQDLKPREVSFKGTLQLLNAFYQLIVTSDRRQLDALCTTLLAGVGEHRVGDRPNRYEPRKRKRAAKPYPPLKLRRSDERKQCLKRQLS